MSNRNDAILIGAIVFTGVSVSAAILIGPNSSLLSNTSAAWVQAIGSILAILVAVAVPVYMRLTEKKAIRSERLLKAKSLYTALMPHLDNTRAELITLVAHFEDYNGKGPPNFYEYLAQREKIIALPNMIVERMPEFYIFGTKICFEIQKVVYEVERLNALQFMLKKFRPHPELQEQIFEIVKSQAIKSLSVFKEADIILSKFNAHWE